MQTGKDSREGSADSNAIGDLMISGTQLSVGAVENLSTLTVRGRNSFQLTGTIAMVSSSSTLTGTGTKFMSELVVGDRIDIFPGSYNSVGTVTAIASDTSLTLDIAASYSATGLQLNAYLSIARFDNAAGAAAVMINDGGDIGIGTLAPRAQLHVTGAGSGEFVGCPVSIRAHSPQGGDAYALVLTCDADDGPSGAAMWVDEFTPGIPELKISPAADMGGMNDTLTVGLNGIGVCGALKVQPTEVATTTYTIQDVDLYVYANAGTSGVTITLPMSTDDYGRVLYIYKTAGAGDITIVPAATDHINGAASNKTINGSFAGLKLVAMYSSWIATTLSAA